MKTKKSNDWLYPPDLNTLHKSKKRFIGIDYEVKEKKRLERLEKYKGMTKTEIIKDILSKED